KLQLAFPTILTRSGDEVGKTNATEHSLETAHRHVHHARSCFLVVCVVVGSSLQRSLF
ncbi:unnamed protein product, partial [Musa acuminata subsp. burmannicoides]